MRYSLIVIHSLKGKTAVQLWEEGRAPRLGAELQKIAQRKLFMLDNASTLADLKSPPGNRLEPLLGDRKGQHSIRINSQWRVCFQWTENGPENVEIVDYHR